MRVSRDTVLFTTGLGGVIFLLLSGRPGDPVWFTILGAMMGSPIFLNVDERRRRRDDEDDDRGSRR